MIKTQIIGHLAHNNKLFSRTCSQCGGIYSNEDTPSCPSCNRPLVPITAKNGRAMMVSEGTIYPIMTQAQKDREAQSRAKRRNSMEITYRFVLMSFANPETGVVTEPPIHKYLTKGRQIMIETNHSPVISWFKANDKSIKCEVRFGILPGDTIRLLGKKESMENLISPEPEIQAKPADTPQPDQIKKIEEAINAIKEMQLTLSRSNPDNNVPEDEPIVIQNEAGDINVF